MDEQNELKWTLARWNMPTQRQRIKSVMQPPAPQEEPKQPTEQDALQKLLSELPREEVEKLIEEYSDDTDFVTFANSKITAKQEAEKPQIDTAALQAEYQARLAKIPNGQGYAVIALKKEFRAKGLNVY